MNHCLPRQQLQGVYDEVTAALEAGQSGATLSHLMCRGVDRLLVELWQREAPEAARCVDLLAVGGYGRAELSPHSDWDLWFIVPDECTPAVEVEMRAFLLLLWDMGAKIGHAVRSVKECLEHIQEDWASATAALESRLLCGQGELNQKLQSKLELFFKQKRKPFVLAKLAELEVRHRRTGGTAFWMEPDIKEGKGGLRDVQAAFWIAKVWYGCDNIGGLVNTGALSQRELEQLLAAQDFLWRCRAALHLDMGRAGDRLGFEQQVTLAERLDYHASGDRPAVDAFMKEYFRHVGRVARVSGLLLMHFNEQLHPRLFSFKHAIGDGFTQEGTLVGIRDAAVFKEEPLRLLRVFHVAQQGQRRLSSQALRQIRADVLLIDDPFRDSPEAQRIFLKILRAQRNVHWALKEMNDTGVLGRFIPQFREVVGLGQFNRYHAYTVDEHTIRAVGEARNFWHAGRSMRLPLAHELCHAIHRPELLYIALLFHDIAKGMPGNHSDEGAKLARVFCQRMRLDSDAAEMVEWLVKEHLFMAVKSQRFDLSDPEVIRDFAGRIGNQNRLRYLLLLTVADIAAVGPNVWNDWKGSLLQELYRLTELYYQSDLSLSDASKHLYQTRVNAVLDGANGQRLLLQGALAKMSQSCIMHFPPRHLQKLAELIVSTDGDGVSYWVDKDRGHSLFFIVARERRGLFAQLAATLTTGHGSIMAARADKLSDGRVLDAFHLQSEDGAPFDVTCDLQRLQSRIVKLLAAEQLATLEIDIAIKTNVLMRRVPVRVQEIPKASFQVTVIEVSAADQPRLLARLAYVITTAGYQLHGASISTFGERVVDVFFVTNDDATELSSDQVTLLSQLLTQVATLPE
ncbi:MAG: [protein-PII] uridylyltransferase [Mariprofundus sp.]|nr:[protein-PII] uridylyltransferase [Mariprofundus sp.]